MPSLSKQSTLKTMKISWRSLAHSTANYLSMHLFLTIISLPILVAWGLPISWLSPIGNFIFSPLLSSFLLVCSLAFFSELFYLPHGFLDWIIEQMTTIWYWMLNAAPNNVLYGIYAPAPWVLTTIAIATAISITHPIMHNSYRRLGILSMLFAMTLGALALATPRFMIKEIPCNNGAVTLIRSRGQTMLIDPGYLGSRGNAASWVAYTFMPELIATTGSLAIDQCIILKPSILTCDALCRLLDDAHVGHIYFPAMSGTLEGSFKRAFGRLYARIKSRNIPFTRITTNSKLISCPNGTTFTVTPAKVASYQTITYTPVTLAGTVEETKLKIAGR